VGQQYSSIWFRIMITVFMFALSLSFLGVWEIPSQDLRRAKREPRLATKGRLCRCLFERDHYDAARDTLQRTVLGSVFAVALTQPEWLVLLIFFAVGLGMALPYLMIAIWPQMLSFLPKLVPGCKRSRSSWLFLCCCRSCSSSVLFQTKTE